VIHYTERWTISEKIKCNQITMRAKLLRANSHANTCRKPQAYPSSLERRRLEARPMADA
jgi:hypothetical protein